MSNQGLQGQLWPSPLLQPGRFPDLQYRNAGLFRQLLPKLPLSIGNRSWKQKKSSLVQFRQLMSQSQGSSGQAHHASLIPSEASSKDDSATHPGADHIASGKSEGPTPSPFKKSPRPRFKRWMIGGIALAVLLIAVSIITYLVQQNGPAAKPIVVNTPPAATSTPLPSPTPTMTQHQRYQQLATQYVDKMSLEDMIGQLMIVQYTTSDISDDLLKMIEQQHVGGVILYSNIADQLRSAEQVKNDTAQMQASAKIPLFIATDEEGYNSVDRLGKIYTHPYHLSAREIHESGDPTIAANEGARVAKDMLALGLNLNFAPVVDVGVKDGYIDHDWRSFGSTPEEVLKYVAPYLSALQQGGVGGTLKHFPGIGSLPYGQDPHGELPVIEHSADEVYSIDLEPFRRLIQSPDPFGQPSMIMPTYVMVPSIDATTPVQYSARFITDILRNELGYDGVVVTDSVVMQGAMYLNSQFLDVGARCVLSLKAGNDIILGIASSTDLGDAITAIKAAVQNGTLTEYSLKRSVVRVLTLKLERGIAPETLLTV